MAPKVKQRGHKRTTGRKNKFKTMDGLKRIGERRRKKRRLKNRERRLEAMSNRVKRRQEELKEIAMYHANYDGRQEEEYEVEVNPFNELLASLRDVKCTYSEKEIEVIKSAYFNSDSETSSFTNDSGDDETDVSNGELEKKSKKRGNRNIKRQKMIEKPTLNPSEPPASSDSTRHNGKSQKLTVSKVQGDVNHDKLICKEITTAVQLPNEPENDEGEIFASEQECYVRNELSVRDNHTGLKQKEADRDKEMEEHVNNKAVTQANKKPLLQELLEKCDTSDVPQGISTVYSKEDAEAIKIAFADEDDDVDPKTKIPYFEHYDRAMDKLLAEQVGKRGSWKTEEQTWPEFGHFTHTALEAAPKLDLIEETRTLEDLYVRQSIRQTWPAMNSLRRKIPLRCTTSKPFTEFQRELFSVINTYKDLMFCRRNNENEDDIRNIYCMHVINHVTRIGSLIRGNNYRARNSQGVEDQFRDQGFFRPRCLILVPFRSSALKIYKCLTELLLTGSVTSLESKNRFIKEYRRNKNNKIHFSSTTPADHRHTFGGNVNDDFSIGIGVGPKAVFMYTNVEECDIILASPLGLRVVIGARGEKSRNFKFLANIELLIVDQVEVILMQNWEHLLHIFKYLHMMPKKRMDCDYARLRYWVLEGWSRYFRQTLAFSQLTCPELSALFGRYCHNYAGVVRVKDIGATRSVEQVAVPVPQVFQKFEASSRFKSVTNRFQFFIEKVLPSYRAQDLSQVLVFIPSYFDYVRVRNYFNEMSLRFVTICEYTEASEMRTNRQKFNDGVVNYLLYTERAHFYHRYHFSRTRHIIFYELPLFPHFYSELNNFMLKSVQLMSTKTCTTLVLFTQYDLHRLAGVVGLDRATYMIQAQKDVFALCTGNK